MLPLSEPEAQVSADKHRHSPRHQQLVGCSHFILHRHQMTGRRPAALGAPCARRQERSRGTVDGGNDYSTTRQKIAGGRSRPSHFGKQIGMIFTHLTERQSHPLPLPARSAL